MSYLTLTIVTQKWAVAMHKTCWICLPLGKMDYKKMDGAAISKPFHPG
jgi:hypothetical protein